LFFVNSGTVMAAEFSGLGDRPVGVPRALFTIPAPVAAWALAARVP
jgi:hypothetical protein